MKKKNAVGALVMAVMILVSVPLGANRSFDRLREEALGAYYYDNTGYGIWEGLDKQEETARNLLTVAERYKESNPELGSYIDDLTYHADRCERLFDNGTLEDVEYHQALCRSAEKLAEKLESLTLEEKDEKYPRQLLSLMQSEQDKVERSSYNDGAREYNQRLERFLLPLKNLGWNRPLGVFGESVTADVIEQSAD